MLTLLLLSLEVPLAGTAAQSAPATQGAGASVEDIWSLSSPDGAITITLSQNIVGASSPGQDGLSYWVEREGMPVIAPAPLGITMAGPGHAFVNNLLLAGVQDSTIDETYTMVSGKQRINHNYANERVFSFATAAGQHVEVVVRAYNDGIAFRYRVPGAGSYNVLEEATGFALPPGATAWLQPYMPFYENLYTTGTIGSGMLRGDFAFPLLYTTNDGMWVLLTEAAVYGNYAGGRLTSAGETDGLLHLSFAGETPTGELPLETPWRVAIIGTSLGTIVESALVDNLNPASEVSDTRWIRPGRVAWSWWSDPTSPRDVATQRAFVDFAHQMGWEYVLVDEGWSADWVPDLVAYAQARNVGILLWAPWTLLDTPSERARNLPRWKRWGIKGIKVDFMNSDSQARMGFYDAISRAALENHLMLNFHGATIPRGQNRRWPHIMTYEAVRGAEYYNYQHAAPTPAYTTILPFTRNVVGPMDYTPVTFSAARRTTTAAHELALAVVFESGWQHFADAPAAYAASAAHAFLKIVPAQWDETRFLDGYPGEFAVLARRSGDRWFIGAINAGTPRRIAIPLDLFGAGSYTAQVYRDGPSPDGILHEQVTAAAPGRIMADLPPNGGLALCLRGTPIGPSGQEPRAFLPLVARAGTPDC